MKRFFLGDRFWLSPALQAGGEDPKRHASDYTRILEVGPADQWADQRFIDFVNGVSAK